MESTTGSWDLYGVQDTKRYASLQSTFFEKAANAARLYAVTSSDSV
jgi:hypothetical protein